MKQNENITENMETIRVVTQEESYKSGAIQYIESREVADVVGKNHADLMHDIRRYVGQLNESKIAPVDFF